jgi:hypothetical protein
MTYNILIKNNLNGNVIQGKTPLVGNFRVTNSATFNMLNPSAISFTTALNAAKNGYEIHVNFIYFEVDVRTNKVVKIDKLVKNITPTLNEEFSIGHFGDLYKPLAGTFYENIAATLKPNPNVIRYIGTPGSNGSCIEVEAWAACESLYDFLRSNQPTNSFVQINNKYTNLTASEGLVFGFISSRVKCPNRYLSITDVAADSLYYGHKTRHLGFRPWVEYKP